MDLFKDKKREGFDELTQLIEPFVFEYNSVVSQLPDKIEITLDSIMSMSRGNLGSYISRSKIIDIALATAGIESKDLKYSTRSLLDSKTYEFQIEGEPQIDMSVPQMTGGTIYAVKQSAVKNDEEIMDMMVEQIERNMLSDCRRASNCPAARFHELSESFGFYEEMKKESTFNGRKRLLRSKILEQVKENKIRIRDFELGVRFAKWINAYIAYENKAALKNLATLKIMSYNNEAIYSINEEEI